MQKTAIIVPCYNEGERFNSEAFSDTAERNELLNFIFVNDGSSDNTLEKLVEICKTNPEQMQCINLEKNSGKAEAVRRGFLRALEMDFINIGYWDADLATPLETIGRFCKILDDTPGAMMVIGSRVKLMGRRIERLAHRHILGRVFATCCSLVLHLPVYDTQCGAKVFRRSEELKAAFSRPFRVNWTFDVEIMARFILIEQTGGCVSLKNDCIEYPLEQWTDIPGSKLRFTDFAIGGIEIMKIFLFLHLPAARRRYIDFLGLKCKYDSSPSS